MIILAVGNTLFLISDRSDENEGRADEACPKNKPYTRTHSVIDRWMIHSFSTELFHRLNSTGVKHTLQVSFVTQHTQVFEVGVSKHEGVLFPNTRSSSTTVVNARMLQPRRTILASHLRKTGGLSSSVCFTNNSANNSLFVVKLCKNHRK